MVGSSEAFCQTLAMPVSNNSKLWTIRNTATVGCRLPVSRHRLLSVCTASTGRKLKYFSMYTNIFIIYRRVSAWTRWTGQLYQVATAATNRSSVRFTLQRNWVLPWVSSSGAGVDILVKLFWTEESIFHIDGKLNAVILELSTMLQCIKSEMSWKIWEQS